MIKCLIGLEEPDSGTITVMGKNINQLEHWELDELRTEIGFLFQGSALYDSMSVRENLEFPLRRHTKKFGFLEDTTPLVMEALENVGLANAINLMPNELSGGEQQRVAIARALLNDPELILADEPSGNLDPQTSIEIMEVLRNINANGKTVIIATHDYALLLKYPSKTLKFEDGKVYEVVQKAV